MKKKKKPRFLYTKRKLWQANGELAFGIDEWHISMKKKPNNIKRRKRFSNNIQQA
jgi:hypothetical protein